MFDHGGRGLGARAQPAPAAGCVRPPGHREAVRPRPGQRPALDAALHEIFDERRSTASTTTSARRRSRTSSPCASPTPSSSRSGTAATSTTCRSRWPSRSGSRQRGGFYEHGRRAPRHRAEPRHAGAVADAHGAARPPSTPRASATRRSRCCGRSDPHRRRGPDRRGARPVRQRLERGEAVPAYRQEADVDPHSQHRDLRGHEARHRQLALGRRARSTSAPASGCPSGSPRWPCNFSASRTWRSAGRRAGSCSRTPWCCGSSPTRAWPCASAPRCRGRRSRCATSAWTVVRHRVPGGGARGLRAAAARRHGRRPDAVHPQRRSRPGLADSAADSDHLGRSGRSRWRATPPGPGVLARPTS